MSAIQDVREIIAVVAGVPPAKAKENIDRAHKEVTRLMEASGVNLLHLCHRSWDIRLPSWDLIAWYGGG